MEGLYTTSDLCKILNVDSVRITKNFNNNKESFTEGIHYLLFYGEGINKALCEIGMPKVSNMVRKIYIWTNKGACLIAQSINKKEADLFLDSLGYSRTVKGYAERVSLSTIEQVLGVRLERQYPVLSYRVDGYCKETNTAYEIDEFHHVKISEFDSKRQKDIEDELGCKFVRVKV